MAAIRKNEKKWQVAILKKDGTPYDMPIVIIESKLDAIFTQQSPSDACCCLALNGAGKKPDLATHNILQTASTL